MRLIEPYLVLKDTREKVGGWEFDITEKCAGIEICTLKTGDYTVRGLEDKLCIERKKSVSELATNIHESRFKDWVGRLSQFKHAFIMLEFSVDDILRFPVGSNIPKKVWPKLRVTSDRILSVIAKIQINYGIQVIYAGDVSNAMVLTQNIMYRTKILYSGAELG